MAAAMKDDNITNVEEISGEAQSNEAPITGVGNIDEIKELEQQSDEDDMKGDHMRGKGDDDVNKKKEAVVEEIISKLERGGGHIHEELPNSIDTSTSSGKEAKNGGTPPLVNFGGKRGRSTLLFFYRLWRGYLVNNPPPPN